MSDFRPSQITGDIGVTIDQINTNNAVISVGFQSSVPTNTLTTIATVPSNGLKYITKIICSGMENAKWDIYIDNVRNITKRTISRTVDFDFSTPLRLAATSVLDVKATHHGPDSTADFEATVLGYAVIP